MISWIVTVAATVLLGACVVIDEIKFDRDLRRYERDRAARLRLLLDDIRKQ